jgi:hypothetical protein
MIAEKKEKLANANNSALYLCTLEPQVALSLLLREATVCWCGRHRYDFAMDQSMSGCTMSVGLS